MEVGEKKSRLTWVRGVSRHVETGLRRARTARRAPRSVLTRDRHNGIALSFTRCIGTDPYKKQAQLLTEIYSKIIDIAVKADDSHKYTHPKHCLTFFF